MAKAVPMRTTEPMGRRGSGFRISTQWRLLILGKKDSPKLSE